MQVDDLELSTYTRCDDLFIACSSDLARFNMGDPELTESDCQRRRCIVRLGRAQGATGEDGGGEHETDADKDPTFTQA